MRASCVSLLVPALVCCASSAPVAPVAGPAIERTEQAIDLSGQWNDVDADQVAGAMIEQCLGSGWIERWRQAHQGQLPVLRLYPVRNKTSGYIDYRYFTKQLEAALVGSGRIDVVSSLDEAEDARTERADQAAHASDETLKAQGEETGSDFILNGWILSEEDAAGGQTVRAYLTSLEVIETATQRKAWVGQKRIKKRITAAGQ